MERKKAQRKAKQLGQGTRLSFGGEGEVSIYSDWLTVAIRLWL